MVRYIISTSDEFYKKKKYLLKNGAYLLKIKKWYDEFDAFAKRSFLL